jgi:DNA-binding transcriptional LysR family regulator
VSHAIARLERSLGVRLFDRSSSGISLTSAGRGLHERVIGAFDEIDRAVASTRSSNSGSVVTLSVATSLATYWLMPRLPAFKRLHPGIELRVITTDSDRSVGKDDADLWIPLGAISRDDLAATPFSIEEVLPVAAPDVAESYAFNDAEALLRAPLLLLEERYSPRFDWPRWFRYHDVVCPSSLGGYSSNDYSLILQAAIDGQGVALGWHHIVASLIDEGRLVALAPPVRTERPFPILQHRHRTLSDGATALRDWLTGIGYRPQEA